MKIKAMIEISIFAVLTAVGARLMVPVPFVPFTLQTLVCMLAGLLLGPKRGAASQALYMAMGLIGIPVFTSAAGPAAVLMPSFGYILGFIGCAWLSGCLRDMFFKKYGSVTRLQYFAAAMAGVAVVYLIGVAYLYVILNFWVKSGGATFFKVLSIGFFSTIAGDAAKAALAAVIARRLEACLLYTSWRGVELSVIYDYMDPASETIYGVDQEMHWLEVRDAFRRAFGRLEFPAREYEATVTLDEFSGWLRELFGADAERYKSVLERFSGGEVMKKGQLAAAVAEIKLLKD